MSNRASVIFFSLILLAASFCRSQTSVLLAPIPQFVNYLQNGQPNAFGCVFTYNSGTTTPLVTYTDSTGNTENKNPVILTAGGTANIWIQSGQSYTFTVKSSGGLDCVAGNTQYTVNGIGGGASTLSVVVPYSPTPAFTLTAQNELISFTLLGNAVSLPLSVTGVTPPAFVTFQIAQNSTGGYSFTWPSNTSGGAPIGLAPNQVTTQSFIWNGTTAFAAGPATTGNSTILTDPIINGTEITSGVQTAILVQNYSVTGTALNTLTKLANTGGASAVVEAVTTDTGGIVGITSAGAGTTGNATVITSGAAQCIFDGATTGGDYVQISATVAGNCHDAGIVYPTSGQVIGRSTTTAGSSGTYTIVLFGPEIQAGPRVLCSNYTPVTVHGNTTSYQVMQTCAFPAGALNKLGKTFRVTTPISWGQSTSGTSSVNFGVGTSATLGQYDILGSLTAPSAGVGLAATVTCITITTGSSGVQDCSQIVPPAQSGDGEHFTNTLDLTGPVYVGGACIFSAASTSNSCLESTLLVEQLN